MSDVILTPGGGSAIVLAYLGEKGEPGDGTGLNWISVSGDLQLSSNNAYLCTSDSLQLLAIPTTGELGDRVLIYGDSSGLFRLTQVAGQSIRFGNKFTTLGITGRIDSLSQGDWIELLCVGSGDWVVANSLGNFEVI